MIENLKIALKRQKKLLIIFFLTIFIPSVALSIFGIRAIRNEKFRLAEQTVNEHRRAAEFLKTQVSARFKDIEAALKNLAQHGAFSDKDYPTIEEVLRSQLAGDQLVGQVFLVYNEESPLFPLFQPITKKPSSLSLKPLKNSERERLKRAEEYEFKQKSYKRAIFLYNQIFTLSKDEDFKAQMLNNIARCYTKLGSYDEAIKYYSQICKEYPESRSSSNLPLCLIARMEILESYRVLGDRENSLESSFDLYEDILQMPWNLNEDQFKTYSSIVEETINEALSEDPEDPSIQKHKEEFAELKKGYQEKFEQWQVINDLKKDIIPELQRNSVLPDVNEPSPFHHSRTIDERSFLSIAVMIPDITAALPLGLLGVKIQNEHLKEEMLGIIEDVQLGENTEVAITDLSGNILLGKRNPSEDDSTITEFFEDNFPPWRIEFSLTKTGGLGIIDIRKSFYFLTILTLIIILTFGAVLIVRTVAHEMEVLKIKSDFVSSVSHEFKTPLTSIRALLERLQEGKVKDPEKMDKYFSVISQDTEKLTRLVKNILDFSKIEERKIEYQFEDTDVVQLISQQINAFGKDVIKEGIIIRTQFEEDIPPLSLDRDAIIQALNNLLDNAVKFSPEKKEISVNVKKDDENIIIEIEDKGIGIPPDEVDKIFDKFYQGESALKQSVKGTGLGLTLVKHIVEAHGGRISVKSKTNQGSTFSLIFPIKRKGA